MFAGASSRVSSRPIMSGAGPWTWPTVVPRWRTEAEVLFEPTEALRRV
jgi:hypothetical protein